MFYKFLFLLLRRVDPSEYSDGDYTIFDFLNQWIFIAIGYWIYVFIMRNKTGEKDKGHMTIGIFLTTIGLMFLLGDLIGGIPIMIIGGLIWYFWDSHLKELFDKITEL